MTTLTMRCIKGYFVVTGRDVEPAEFKSRREAKDRCMTHYSGSPITEIGRDAARSGRAAPNANDVTMPPARALRSRGRGTGTVGRR